MSSISQFQAGLVWLRDGLKLAEVAGARLEALPSGTRTGERHLIRKAASFWPLQSGPLCAGHSLRGSVFQGIMSWTGCKRSIF